MWFNNITRDIRGFSASALKVFTPEEFLVHYPP